MIETTSAIVSHYDNCDWEEWVVPEGHEVISVEYPPREQDAEILKRHEYVVRVTHAPKAEALAHFCERVGARFIPAVAA